MINHWMRWNLPFLARSTTLMAPLLCLLAACGDNLGDPSMAPDARVPVTCADVQCDENATCNDTSGDAVCTCNAGYEGDGASCSDIDECAAAQSPCHQYARCDNTDGSFTCTCNEGATGDGLACTYPASCADLVDDPNPTSGVYTIDPDGEGAVAAFAVYCDMTTPGEGWTLAFVKNSVDAESYADFGAAYDDLVHLQVHPNAASQDTVPRSGWVDLNTFPYTHMRITTHNAGAETYRSELIDHAELRIAFGEDGYYLYDDSHGYYWCGGASSYTDAGQGQVNKPDGAPDDCKNHVGLGDGWDFSLSDTVNRGLTLVGGTTPEAWMSGDFGVARIFYPNSGAAQAIWVSTVSSTGLVRDALAREEACEAREGQHLDREEVAGRDGIPVRTQERLPRGSLGALRCWIDPLLLQTTFGNYRKSPSIEFSYRTGGLPVSAFSRPPGGGHCSTTTVHETVLQHPVRWVLRSAVRFA